MEPMGAVNFPPDRLLELQAHKVQVLWWHYKVSQSTSLMTPAKLAVFRSQFWYCSETIQNLFDFVCLIHAVGSVGAMCQKQLLH